MRSAIAPVGIVAAVSMKHHLEEKQGDKGGTSR